MTDAPYDSMNKNATFERRGKLKPNKAHAALATKQSEAKWIGNFNMFNLRAFQNSNKVLLQITVTRKNVVVRSKKKIDDSANNSPSHGK